MKTFKEQKDTVSRLASPEVDVALIMRKIRLQSSGVNGGVEADRDMSALGGRAAIRRLAEFLEVANDDFIELVYVVILTRDVDNRGFYYYMRQLDGGRSRVEIIIELLNSGEASEKASRGKVGAQLRKQHDQLRVEIEEIQVATQALEKENAKSKESAVLEKISDIQESSASVPVKKPIDPMRIQPLAVSNYLSTYNLHPSYHVEELLWGEDREFVDRAYEVILGRKPDAEGEAYYIGKLAANESRVSVLSSFLNSEEAAKRKIKVRGIAFRRVIEVFANSPLTGVLFRRLADRSKEDYVHVESLTAFQDEEFVKHLYRSVLGRTPDQAGFDRYIRSLRNGEDKIDLIWDVRNSKEGASKAVRVGGLWSAFVWSKLIGFPLVGTLCVVLVAPFRLAAWRRKATRNTAYAEQAFIAANRNMTNTQQAINNSFSVVRKSVDELAERVNSLSAQTYDSVSRSSFDSMVRVISSIENAVSEIKDKSSSDEH